MTKQDDTIQLLREIRDLQRQQLSMMREQRDGSVSEKRMELMKLIVRIAYNIAIGAFVVVAFWYFYKTMYGSGLL